MIKTPIRLVLVVSCLCLPAITWADWPQWRGPDRTGYVDAQTLRTTLPAEGLKPVWKLDDLPGGNSGGWSSPVISQGRVLVYSHTKVKSTEGELGPQKYPWLPPEKRTMTDEEYKAYEVKRRDEDEQRSKAFRYDQRLLCLDLKTGNVIWDKSDEVAYTRFVQSSTPCVADRRVFALGPSRTAYCYDADSGNIVWTKKLPGDFRDQFFSSSFVVSGKVALIACGPLYALNVEDGQILWNGDEDTEYQSHSSPVVWRAGESDVAVTNTSGGRTQAYRIADGKLLWELNAGAGQSTPIIAGDLLLTYGSSRKSGLTAFRLNPSSPQKQPEQAWQFQGAADSGSTPVVRGDAVFVQGEKRLAKVSLADGATTWQATLKISNPRYTSLVAAGDQLFYAWEGLLAVDADADSFQPIYDAEVDFEANLIAGDDLRNKLGLNELSATKDGLAESEKIWQQKAIKSGPLACSTPAFSDGRIVLRLRRGLVCYDLRQ